MVSGVLCLIMLIFFRKLLRKSVSFTYLILILEFTYFSSSHEKLLYQMLFEIEADVPQNSLKSSVLIKLLYAYSFTKDKHPFMYFIRKSFLEEQLSVTLDGYF